MAKRKLKHGTRITAKPRALVSLAPTTWDRGADGPANRDGLVIEDRPHIDPETGKRSNPNGVRGVRRNSPVKEYHLRGIVSREGLSACEELMRLHEGAPRQDPLAALAVDGGGTSLENFDRRRPFHAVWAKIPPEFRPVLEAVVLEEKEIESRDRRKMEDRINRFSELNAAIYELLTSFPD